MKFNMIHDMIGNITKSNNDEQSIDKIRNLITHLSNKHFKDQLVTQFANINGTIRFATDIDTHTVIWANEQSKKMFGSDMIGNKCSNVLNNIYHDCDNCIENNMGLEHEKIYTTIDNNNLNGDTYLIRTVIFEVEGKNVKFEEAINITSYIDIIKKI